VPEEKNKEGLWVPKGTKPVLQLSHQQVIACTTCRMTRSCKAAIRLHNTNNTSNASISAVVFAGVTPAIHQLHQKEAVLVQQLAWCCSARQLCTGWHDHPEVNTNMDRL